MKVNRESLEFFFAHSLRVRKSLYPSLYQNVSEPCQEFRLPGPGVPEERNGQCMARSAFFASVAVRQPLELQVRDESVSVALGDDPDELFRRRNIVGWEGMGKVRKEMA